MHQIKTGWAILVTCMSSLAISACSSDPEEPAGESSVEVVPEDTSLGSFTILMGADASPGATAPAKYTECGACHQSAGQGLPSLAPEIRHTPAAYASWVVRNGRGPTSSMAAFPVTSLSDVELNEIINWSNALPKPTTGAGLYMDFCGNCHGPASATGGRVGVKLKPGIAGATVDAAVRGGFGADPSVRTKYMPKFEETLLTSAELALIKTYMGAK